MFWYQYISGSSEFVSISLCNFGVLGGLSFLFPLARSGYRIQVDPQGNATRAIYYMEQELSNLDPSRPANYNRCE